MLFCIPAAAAPEGKQDEGDPDTRPGSREQASKSGIQYFFICVTFFFISTGASTTQETAATSGPSGEGKHF